MTARDVEARQNGRPEPLFLATLLGQEVRCDAGQVVALPDDDELVRALVGERRPDGTRVVLGGRRLDRSGTATRVRRGLAVVRGTEVADDVSVLDHLAATVGGHAARSLLAAAPLLAHRGDDPAGVLSGGERRVLGWLQAQAAQPRAVLLDRAGTGLDAGALRWAHEAVDRWLAAGAGVLVRPGRPEETAWIAHRADGRPRAANGRV
jgi:ABC-type lipopolysaccharide export system ATPase subunit